jgi:UDP-GlcNAc:undecaprenyl-phosphate GlcNAc-1-phosphate transferase
MITLAIAAPPVVIGGATSSEAVRTMSWDDVLSPYIYVFYAAFIVSFLLTPLMRRVALYYNVIDQPDARKMHSQPVAYLGGVAVFLGWIVALATSQFVTLHRTVPGGVTHLIWPVQIVIAGTLIVILGLYDDIAKANPWAKIVVQVVAGLILVQGDVGYHCTAPLLAPVTNRLLHYLPWITLQHYTAFVHVTSALLVVGLVVGCCNATNLMDGLDGLCGGVTVVVAAGFVFLTVHMATFGDLGTANNEGMRVVLALALLGAVFAFVPYNFNPASIFLGDTGSMFIGFVCATLIAMMAEQRAKWFLSALVIFALPVLDTALAFVRRWVNKRPIFSADRHHIHHQLVNRGFTVKQTVLISYALAFGFCILGIAIVFMRTRYVVAFYLVIFGSIIVAALKMGLVHEKEVVKSPNKLSDVKTLTPGDAPQYASDSVMEVRGPAKATEPIHE